MKQKSNWLSKRFELSLLIGLTLAVIIISLSIGANGKHTNKEAERVDVTPTEWIIESPIVFSAKPNEAKPSGYELFAGKVVQVTQTSGEWVKVNIFTYDGPYDGDIWLPKKVLTQWEAAKAQEGRLREGANVYAENGSMIKAPSNTPIRIEESSGERYRISAPGGFTGFIDKADFLPNPFSKNE